MLTGKYREPPEFGPDDHRSGVYWFRGREFRRRADVVERIRELADDRGLSVAQIALAWTADRPGVSAVLAGARSADQVRENAAAAGALSDDDVRRIDGWVAEAFRPPRLHPEVTLTETDARDGSVEMTDNRTGAAMTMEGREAFILRGLESGDPYEEIAEAWNARSDRPLISAQVKVFVDQLAELGLVTPRDPSGDPGS
jgi:hypothetical protein